MKSLSTLIRLRQHEMDSARRALVELEKKTQAVENRTQALEEEFSAESARARGNVEASFSIGKYISAVRLKRIELGREMHAVEQEVALAEANVRDAFRELKRFELAETMERDRVAKAESDQEQTRLDEVALSSFRQNDEDYA